MGEFVQRYIEICATTSMLLAMVIFYVGASRSVQGCRGEKIYLPPSKSMPTMRLAETASI